MHSGRSPPDGRRFSSANRRMVEEHRAYCAAIEDAARWMLYTRPAVTEIVIGEHDVRTSVDKNARYAVMDVCGAIQINRVDKEHRVTVYGGADGGYIVNYELKELLEAQAQADFDSLFWRPQELSDLVTKNQ